MYINKKATILILSNSHFQSGAEQSLFDLIIKTNHQYNFILAIPIDIGFSIPNLGCKTYSLPFDWFYKTLNPYRNLKFIYSVVITIIRLCIVIKKNNVHIVYANTFKAGLYGVIVKVFTRKKLIWHARDNMTSSILKKFIIRKSVAILSISKHIHKQFPVDLKYNYLIYGGIDTNFWKPKEIVKVETVLNRNNNSPTLVIACVGQLTRWKNHIDFIKAAKILLDKYNNIRFLVVGDDLSGREQKYKKELEYLVERYRIETKLTFLGNRNDVKEIMNQIDILVHPAINEPFGRVIIEAMAMEKPVIAYNCGGPAEIIVDGETGFLVELKNYQQLSKKTMVLIENSELRIKMGIAGRQRVIEKFNIERHAKEMKDILNII